MNFKKMKWCFLIVSAALIGFTSCEKEVIIDDTSEDIVLGEITTQYVDAVVLPTYKSLSDASIELEKAVRAFKDSKSQADAQKVADLWKSTRVFWEESEAFLFGPVDVLGIDPHIDTWPMNEDSYNAIVNDAAIIASLGTNGDKVVSEISDQQDGVLGFHSIEYIFFRNGQIREASSINDAELTLAVAVAGDLRNECCLIEAGWLGEAAIGVEKAAYAQRTNNYYQLAAEFPTPYATTMKEAPNATFASKKLATLQILEGAIDIADEVGSAKIGQPYHGASDDDKNYIESKYSYNSKVDFAGNIRSIKNAYLGAISSNSTSSVSNYLASKNAALDAEVKTAIDDAITKIEAIQNFEINANSESTRIAMEACVELLSKLEAAREAMN